MAETPTTTDPGAPTVADGPDLGHLAVDPAAMLTAAGDLDGLADRLERTLARSGPTLTVPAAGRDEVSVRTAESFSTVAQNFASSATAGVLELRKIAAELRAQARGLAVADDAAAAELRL